MELILGISIVSLMTLRIVTNFSYSVILIAITSLVLSLIYFFLSFGLLNEIRLRNIFKKESYAGKSSWRIIGTILTGLVLSLVVIYSLFKFMRWPFGNEGLRISLYGLIIVLVITIIKLVLSKNKFYRNLLIRLGIIGLFANLLYLTSEESILEMKYRNYPEYVDAEKKLMKDPMNKELQELVRKERIKMDKTE